MTHYLATELKLPVLGICDWNPFGVALLMTYILGSFASGLEVGNDDPHQETYRYCVHLKWIGLHYQDIVSLHLPDSVREPFSKVDRVKCRALQKWHW